MTVKPFKDLGPQSEGQDIFGDFGGGQIQGQDIFGDFGGGSQGDGFDDDQFVDGGTWDSG